MRGEQNGRETPWGTRHFQNLQSSNSHELIEQQNRMEGLTLSHYRYVFFIFYYWSDYPYAMGMRTVNGIFIMDYYYIYVS